MRIKTEIITEIKTIPANLASLDPKIKSERKSRKIASQKNEKYIMPKIAKIPESQKGINKIESRSTIKAEILSVIVLILHASERNTNQDFKK